MTTKEVLIAARANVKEGWTQGAYYRDGKCCAKGALYLATTDARTLLRAQAVLERMLGWYLLNWNDAPERTQADVIDLFDRAIEAQS